MAEETSVQPSRQPAIAPDQWHDSLSIDVRTKVLKAADDINDAEWLRHKSIAAKLREIRTLIGEQHPGNWIAFTRSNELNISSRQAQDLEAAHDWLAELPIEQKVLAKMSTRTIALAAKFCSEDSKKEAKILAALRKGALSEPELKKLAGKLSAEAAAPAMTQKKWKALKNQLEEDGHRLRHRADWYEQQLREMTERLNALRTDRGSDPIPVPVYEPPAYEGVIDEALRREGAVTIARNTRSKTKA